MELYSAEEQKRIDGLDKQITRYRRIAWSLVITGGLAAVGAVLIWASGYFGVAEIGPSVGGTAGALWALSGFFFVYIAFLGQERHFINQQAELRATREELGAHEEQFRRQNEQAREQSFENTFFQLLELHNEITQSLTIAREEPPVDEPRRSGTISGGNKLSGRVRQGGYEGRSSFKVLYQRLESLIEREADQQKGEQDAADAHAVVKVAYDRLYEHHQADIGHYFRNLYHIFKLADETEAIDDREERQRYASLARAQLSVYELLLLFYNGLFHPVSEGEERKFKLLIEKYHLFDNMHKEPSREAHMDWYDSSAFE